MSNPSSVDVITYLEDQGNGIDMYFIQESNWQITPSVKIIPSSSFTCVSLEIVYKWIGKKIIIECMGKKWRKLGIHMSSKHEIKQKLSLWNGLEGLFHGVFHKYTNILQIQKYLVLSVPPVYYYREWMHELPWEILEKKNWKLAGLQFLQISPFQDGSSSTGHSSCLKPAVEWVPLHEEWSSNGLQCGYLGKKKQCWGWTSCKGIVAGQGQGL